MKKSVVSSVMCFVALSLCVISCSRNSHEGTKGVVREETGSYVDLGLSSGTKWCSVNEKRTDDAEYDFFSYDEAVSEFGGSLPTKELWEELKSECQWTWEGSGYQITGPNGNTISLPALGYCNCFGRLIHETSCGYYWSSSSDRQIYGWRLDFDADHVRMYFGGRCNKGSVRLVQN